MSKSLQLEFSSGKFSEYSSTAKEGFVEQNKGFKKFHDSVKGELLSASVRDSKIGQQICLVIKDEENDYCYTNIPLYDNKNQIGSYAESLITYISSLSKGTKLELSGYNFKPDDSKYSKIGVSIKVDGNKIERTLSASYYNKKGEFVKGDIPALVFEEDPLTKKKMPTLVSIAEKEKFLKTYLAENLKRLEYVKDDSVQKPAGDKPQISNKVPTATPEQAFAPVDNLNDDEFEDLPF